MAIGEKEYNGYILDQLSIAERLERAYKRGDFEDELEIVKREIQRKLYQQPPMTES